MFSRKLIIENPKKLSRKKNRRIHRRQNLFLGHPEKYEASVSTTNGLLKSGRASTGVVDIATFNFSNAA
jgi:hypothetical protein